MKRWGLRWTKEEKERLYLLYFVQQLSIDKIAVAMERPRKGLECCLSKLKRPYDRAKSRS